MSDVFTLLSLPETSKAFTSLSSTVITVAETVSASPPRKTRRLDSDLDSASASRSRRVDNKDSGTIRIKVAGIPLKSSPDNRSDADVALVTRSIRVLLARGSDVLLPATFEQIYGACRSAVTISNKGEGLFTSVKLELEKSVGSLVKDLLVERRADVEWLVPFIEACAWFEKQVGLLRSVLTYLDRIYIMERKDLLSIRELAYDLFSSRVFESGDIMQKLRASIQSWIEWERTNRVGHELRDHVPDLIRHLYDHGQYTRLFEPLYIELTNKYYTAESTERVEKLKETAQEFLHHCQSRRDEEIQRAEICLPQASWAAVVDTTDKSLLTGRLEWLAKDALGELIDTKQETDLADMYMLFARVDGLRILQAAFKLHVQTTVRKIVKDVEHDEDMVPCLLEFKAFGDKLLLNAFADEEPVAGDAAPPSKASTSAIPVPSVPKKVLNKDFGYALIDAFQTGFKARRNKPAEMIAKHLDRAMRKGQKGKKDEDFQAELDAVLGLYRFTDDKDVFRTFYHRALAKRLLLERSASDDFEKAMLKRLKEQYDPEFGMGDHMFNDLALSRDSLQEYIDHRTRVGDAASAQKLSVMVLQRSFWPFAARTEDVDIPPHMQEDLAKYSAFYKSKHQGHKLDWDHALGTALLRARFKNGEKELSVSLYQAVVLLLFNDSTELSFSDTKVQTRMEDAELRRTLQSLACGKKRVLKKHPPGKDVNDGDTFQFNADFTDQRYQVHINSIQAKETLEESKRTQTSIEGDRKHALDAAIVRVMKARKELHYEALKTATIDAVKSHFVPEVSSIKKRIQGLVEQEYLRRDETDMNLYIYVA
ncbi:Cullin-domain-containing protein [Amylocystis lapponica]|nr:Cullin-domain-containing protein [Amylocystis lapponica]